MHLKQKLVINVTFVIWNFGTSLQMLYNHYFSNFLQNYEANLTENELLTLLYDKINDFITKILLLLA